MAVDKKTRNQAIAEMLADGTQLRSFYRFAAQNPHIEPYEACQILIARPSASVCFSFEEWGALGRRITKGRKGILYFDRDGEANFVFDAADTNGETRYQRPIFPMKRLLLGLDELNGSENAETPGSDYEKILQGVKSYLSTEEKLTGDDQKDKLLTEGVAYSLYARTGFPKDNGIALEGLPYSYKENAEFFKEVYITAALVQQEAEDAFLRRVNEVKLIDDTDEETVSDEPYIPSEPSEEEAAVERKQYLPFYERYLEVQNEYPQAVVLQRVGDFYEVLGEKAVIVAEELDLTQTSRLVGEDERVPMCGFPYHVTDVYVEKILEKHPIAYVEENEDTKYILSHDEVQEYFKEKDATTEDGHTMSAEEREKAEARLVEHDLKRGSSFEDGKLRIYEFYHRQHPSQPEFAAFLKKEYGWGGSYTTYDQKHDSSGITLDYKDKEHPENSIHIKMKWGEVAQKVAALLDEDRYLSEEEKAKYATTSAAHKPVLETFDDDEPNPFDDEEEQPDFVGDIDTRFPIHDEYEDDDVPQTDREEALAEYYAELEAEREEAEADGADTKPQKARTKRERKPKESPQMSIFDLMGGSENGEEEIPNIDSGIKPELQDTPQERLIRQVIMSASVGRKRRLMEARQKARLPFDFANAVFAEYKDSFERGNDYHAQYDARGVFLTRYDDEGNTEFRTNISFEAFADRIDTYIAQGEYFTLDDEDDEDWEKLIEAGVLQPIQNEPKHTFNRFKELSEQDREFFERYSMRVDREPSNSPWGAVQYCRSIANGIYSVDTAGHGGIMIAKELASHILSEEAVAAGISESGYYCYEEDELKNIPLRELYDKGILRRDSEYFTSSYINIAMDGEKDDYEPFDILTEEQKEGFFASWSEETDKAIARWHPDYWQAHERAELDETQQKIKSIVDGIVKEGTENTSEGNWIIYFDEFKEDEKFVREHKDEIETELASREAVAEVTIDEECIDTTYYLDYCPNYAGADNEPSQKEKGADEIAIGDKYVYRGRTMTVSGLEGIYPNEVVCSYEDSVNGKVYTATQNVDRDDLLKNGVKLREFVVDLSPGHEAERREHDPNRTDLNRMGFDQKELGGAKTRFRNNVAAIRTVKRLYAEDRFPTVEERRTLIKFVGWGGISQAFDEQNEEWSSEYKELKELLSPEEYDSARGSTLNAHYTSRDVIDGIYVALHRFGVRGNNRILEPAVGTGNFFGYLPDDVLEGSKLYGVEIDSMSARIAAKLYPQANIQIKGFEETSFPDGRFDVVVGNVPFGGYTVFDSAYNKYNFYIHDYFLAKSIDKLKAGGVMAVVTSKGTMDKLNPTARKYLADRAELLGAVRLPNTAFKQTAGTEAVADILFFRKREEPIDANTKNTEWLSTGKTEEGYEINSYFINHPEMILGTLTKEVGLYGAEDITVKPDGRELSEAIREAVERLPEHFYHVPEEAPAAEKEEVDYNVKPLCFKAENGRVYVRLGDEMVERDIPKTPKDAYYRIKAMIELRDELHHILDIQIQGCSDEVLAKEQRKLNWQYDSFVRRYGNLNSMTNARLFREDGDSALVFATEIIDKEMKKVSKADIFFKRTIRPYIAPTQTDDALEAMRISKNERGKVDISYIEELTRKDYDTVLSELGDTVFRDPQSVAENDKYSGFVTAEEYLSGQVVTKLHEAREYAETHPDFERNVKALEAVQPERIRASDISVRLGASWVDKKYYLQFYKELIGLPEHYAENVHLFYNPYDSSWRLDQMSFIRSVTNMSQTEVYGTRRAPACQLFEDAMNLRATSVYDTVDDGYGGTRRVLNQNETIAAREKQNKIKEAFKQWIYADPERREELEETYNRLFNRIRLPSYDGSYLKFPEMNPSIELNPHQKNAVQRIITGDGSTLLHHVVGAGKTYTMIASIMKMRQLGLCKKAMVVVPNHIVQQWADDWRKLYPNAKILIATKEDLEKDNRQKFTSKVALGDWDGIIIAQSSFAKIPISRERQIEKLREEIRNIEETVRRQWEENKMPHGAVKNLERIKKSRTAKLEKLMDDDKKDSHLLFENLGVDYLYIDEAHLYKNLFLFSKMNNVAGISNAASQKASDLKLKCEYLQELHGSDRGIVFATGTPISNSMTEMYTMQSYMQPSVLSEAGLPYFDAWAADFGETVTSLELAPSGQGYRARTRFAKFTNLPELLTMYRSFADVQTQDMLKLPVPEAERHVINLKPSDTVLQYVDEIAKRAEAIHNGIDPSIDNMLKVTTDGKKLALDPRCYSPDAPDEEGSKINVCAAHIHEIWENTADIKGTQIVFCDLSTPSKRFEDYKYGEDFDAYNELKYKLVSLGIPAEQIAFMHEANTDEQKQALFDKVRSGAVRVLMGSTAKCGAGTNVQTRLVALHHLDTPYRPSDMEQREGRIIRQGNKNAKVHIYTYVMERTFDSYSYQILENKQRFISQIDNGDMTVREAEDIDDRTLTYAEIKALTAANPKIKRKMEVDTEVARLRVLESQYMKNLFDLQDKIRKSMPEAIQRQETLIERVHKDNEELAAEYDAEKFSINVNGVVYTDKKEGGKALTEAIYAGRPETVIAEYCGFKISIDAPAFLSDERSITLKRNGQYTINVGQSPSGNLTRLDNFMTQFSEREGKLQARLDLMKSELAIAKEQAEKPFDHAEELATLLREQSQLNEELNLDRQEEVVVDEGDDDKGEGSYSALPEQVEQMSRKPRRRLNHAAIEQYEKQKSETPEAHIFYKNGDGYDVIGERAEKLASDEGLELRTEKIDGMEYPVVSIKEADLDRHISRLVGDGEKAIIIEPLPKKKEGGLIEEETEEADTEREESQPTEGSLFKGDFVETTKQGYSIEAIFRDTERKHAIVCRDRYGDSGDYLVALGYDEKTGEWEQGRYDFQSYEDAESYLKENYPEATFIDHAKGRFTPNYEQAVREAVEAEYARYEEERAAQGDQAENAFKTDAYTALRDVIARKAILSDWDYRALYEERGNNLTLLYDDYLKDEGASFDTEADAEEFIKMYNWHHHPELMSQPLDFEEGKPYYFGEENHTGYYYLPALNRENQSFIKTHSLNCIIAAPVCNLPEGWLAEHHVTFLKVDRDISSKELGDAFNVKEAMRKAKEGIEAKKQPLTVGGGTHEEKVLAIMQNFCEQVERMYGGIMERVGLSVVVDNTQLPQSTVEEVVNKYGGKVKNGDIVISEELREKMSDISERENFGEFVSGLRAAYFEKERAEEINKFRGTPLYLHTAKYAMDHGELEQYRASRVASMDCRSDIEQGISENFKESILNTDFLDGLIEKYGIERVSQVCAVTIRESDWDLRYSRENKEWAATVPIVEEENRRGELHLSSHPLLVDAVTKKIREKIKEIEENKEEEKMPEQANTAAAEKPQKKWLKYKVSTQALISEQERTLWMRMPQDDPEYRDFTYNVNKRRVDDATILKDAHDDREEAFEITIGEEETMRLKNRKGEERELTAREFIALVNKSSSERYFTPQSARTSVVLPREAVIKTYDNATLFSVPNGAGYDGYIYYLPNAVLREDTSTEKGEIVASLGEGFTVTLRKGEEEVKISAEEFAKMCGHTSAEDYKRKPTAMDEYREQQGGEDQKKWQSIPLNENAVLHRYEGSTLLKMPNGEYAGLVCYVPNGFIREDDNGMSLRIPEDFTVHLKGDDKTVDISAAEFAEAVSGKGDEDYVTLRKPSEEKVKAFEQVESRLRRIAPREMLQKPNWVVVRTQENVDTGRLNKYLIDVHTGKGAKSNDASTWADFDTACAYAKENGGVALAYALDGKDKIACIDLDGCFNENGELSDLAKDALARGGNTYTERSVSGKGVHIFGKTDGMKLRAFSKDGDLEFYQNSHFITMTGDGAMSSQLTNFDQPAMRSLLESKCERQTEWKNTGTGEAGLSSMDDREVLNRAMSAKNGDTFKRLYAGEDLRNNHSNSDMSLMNQLAFWCGHDKDQMLRIFATSGLYRQDKPQSYYEYTAIKAVKSTPAYKPPKASSNKPAGNGSGSGKGGK